MTRWTTPTMTHNHGTQLAHTSTKNALIKNCTNSPLLAKASFTKQVNMIHIYNHNSEGTKARVDHYFTKILQSRVSIWPGEIGRRIQFAVAKN